MALTQSDLRTLREGNRLILAEASASIAALRRLAARQAVVALRDVLPAIIDRGGLATAALAADWYDDVRERAEVAGSYEVLPVDPGDRGAQALIGWAAATATDDAAFWNLIDGGTIRRILGPERETIMGAAVDDPASRGWAWFTAADACEFCRMLAGRGGVYTEATVQFRSHDSCGCVPGPDFGGLPGRLIPTRSTGGHPPGGTVPPVAQGGGEDDPEWSSAERAVVDYLRLNGHVVGPGGRAPGGQRYYDATVDGVRAEFKSPRRGATSATMRNRARESKKAGGQARLLVFDVRGTGMSDAEAQRGIDRIRGAYSEYFDLIRVVGDGFDLSGRM